MDRDTGMGRRTRAYNRDVGAWETGRRMNNYEGNANRDYYDDEPYNPQADPSVDEQINALLLEWTPSNTAETSEDTMKVRKDYHIDDNIDEDETTRTEVEELQGEPSEEQRRRPRVANGKSIKLPNMKDTTLARNDHLNYDSDQYSDASESDERTFDQCDRSEPASYQLHQATVEAVSDEALQKNKNPSVSSSGEGDKTAPLQDKGKQPARPFTFLATRGVPS
ncbi:hypothetical protein VP1G_01915 [Cytospora mali]|uniref:Uncharacterized protein n=1 Tax=Cytospora mali TaxID=578113 RepID=A0A194USI7_CYTMA|nr:hypothetical protein VP1G_01915 [Valsa mali var. pyri (nom. inval.)]